MQSFVETLTCPLHTIVPELEQETPYADVNV